MNQKSGIKIFRGVYSRENVPAKIAKKECGSINLETEIGIHIGSVTEIVPAKIAKKECGSIHLETEIGIHIGSVTEIQKKFVNILIYSV